MEDYLIIELFFGRDGAAVRETEKKYGKYCLKTAFNVLGNVEDARECVNDAYLKLWNAIPPARPDSLKLFAARITRNLAIDRYRKERHGPGFETLRDELGECVPPGQVESAVERGELLKAVNGFLENLPGDKRTVFLDRYWYFLSVKEIAEKRALTDGNVKMTLSRTRKKLKKHLKGAGLL